VAQVLSRRELRDMKMFKLGAEVRQLWRSYQDARPARVVL
jgi:hypothetical protein